MTDRIAPRPLAVPTYARTVLATLTIAIAYLWVFPYHSRVGNPNENVRVYMTVALVDDHTFAINRIERDWGYTNDKATRLGQLYSSKAPGASLLGVPGYWLLTKITGRDSKTLTPAQIAAHHKPPLDRTVIVYFLRLWTSVLPGIIFAWFWHRFLGRHTRSPALREAAFYATMLGSPLFAYSEMFASHSQNAFCAMGGLMAIETLRREQRELRATGGPGLARTLGLMFTGGLFGAAATMFEYPAAVATFAVALLILATSAEKRFQWVIGTLAFAGLGAVFLFKGHKAAAALSLLLAFASYAVTLTPSSALGLVAAGLGGAIPAGLTMLFHKKCFGDPLTPGYKYLENAQFNAETSQGFYGATTFSWEAALRLWLDPAFGMIPGTALLLAAVLGLGAYFSVDVSRRAKLATAGVVAAIFALGTYKLVPLIHTIKTAGWTSPAAHELGFLGIMLAALIALCAVLLPRPPNTDRAVGAAMMLSCFGLSRLIGSMNNWRGGWTVGPRYLTTLVPMLALAALVGLEAFSQGNPTRRRAATLFAAGATVHAILITGLASAYFPHIPLELTSPLFDLIVPLLRADVAPYNAGRYLLHLEGLRGMIPFFLVLGISSLVVLLGDERRVPLRIAHAMGGLTLALLMLVPFPIVAMPNSSGAVRYVKSAWDPPLGPVTTPTGITLAPAAIREHGRQMAEQGDSGGALEAFRRAAAAER